MMGMANMDFVIRECQAVVNGPLAIIRLARVVLYSRQLIWDASWWPLRGLSVSGVLPVLLQTSCCFASHHHCGALPST